MLEALIFSVQYLRSSIPNPPAKHFLAIGSRVFIPGVNTLFTMLRIRGEMTARISPARIETKNVSRRGDSGEMLDMKKFSSTCFRPLTIRPLSDLLAGDKFDHAIRNDNVFLHH